MQTFSFNFTVATAARLIVNLIGAVVIALLTRHLGTTDFGYYSAVMSYIFIGIILADMGLHMMLVREISQHDDQERDIVSKLFTLRLITIVIVVVIGLLLLKFFGLESTLYHGVLITSLFLIFSSLSQVVLGVFQKHLRLYSVSIADVVTRMLQLGLVGFAIWSQALTLTVTFWIVVCTEAIRFIGIMILTRRIVRFTWMIDIPYWKRILRTALPIAASLVFTLLYFRIDTVMIASMQSAHEAGIYAAAYKVLEIAIVIPALYMGLLMPQLSAHAKNDMYAFKQKLYQALSHVIFMAVPVALGAFVFARLIIVIIGGASFAASVSVLHILSIAIFLIYLGNVVGHSVVALDVQKYGMYVYGMGALINIVANSKVIPLYGAVGAAWTTVGTELLVTIGLCLIVRRAMRPAT